MNPPTHRIEVIGGLRFFKAGERENFRFGPSSKRFFGYLALHLGQPKTKYEVENDQGEHGEELDLTGAGSVSDAQDLLKRALKKRGITGVFIEDEGLYGFDPEKVVVDFYEIIEGSDTGVKGQKLLPGMFGKNPEWKSSEWLEQKQAELDEAIERNKDKPPPILLENHARRVRERLEITAENQAPSFAAADGDERLNTFFTGQSQVDFPLPFIDPMVVPSRYPGDKPEPELLRTVIEREYKPIILLAGGGGGKSTAMASLWWHRCNESYDAPTLLASLSDLNDLSRLDQCPVNQLLNERIFGEDRYRKKTMEGPKTFLILDGLNELSERVREHALDIAGNLKDMAHAYFNSESDRRLVLGCRPQELAQASSVLGRLPEDLFVRYDLCSFDFNQAFRIFTDALARQRFDASMGEQLKQVLTPNPELLTNPLNLSLLLQGIPRLKERMENLADDDRLTRADLLCIALDEILGGDEKRERDDGHSRQDFFINSTQTRFALQLMAAVLLHKAKGATSLDRDFLVTGIQEFCEREEWEWQINHNQELVIIKKGRERPDEFVEALGELRLVAVNVTINKAGQFSFQHDVWRDYMAATLLVKAGWARGKVDFEGICQPAWQEAILLAIELTKGCIEPIKETLLNKGKNYTPYQRRRAAQIWERTDDADLEMMISLYDIKDKLVSDTVGHSLRNKMINIPAFGKQVQEKCVELLKSASETDRKKGVLIANGMGSVSNANVRQELIKIIGDAKQGDQLRASAISVTQQLGEDETITKVLKKRCSEKNGAAHGAAWWTLWSRARNVRNLQGMLEMQKLTEQFFAKNTSCREHFHLIQLLARTSANVWMTRKLVSIFIDLEHSDEDCAPAVRWYIALSLGTYMHRRHIIGDQAALQQLKDTTTNEPLLQRELVSLLNPTEWGKQPLYDAKDSLSQGNIYLPQQGSFWNSWVNYIGNKRKGSTSGNSYYDDLPILMQLHRLFYFSSEALEECLDEVERNLKAYQTQRADENAPIAAAILISKVGFLNERVIELRTWCLRHEDPHLVSLCTGLSMNVLLPFEERIIGKNMMNNHKDESVRWHSGDVLSQFAPNVAHYQILKRMFRDSSSLVRGIASDCISISTEDAASEEVEDIFIEQLQVEQDAYALARLIRRMAFGTLKSQRALEEWLARSPLSKSATRIGLLNEIAAEAISSIERATATKTLVPIRNAS